MLKNHPQKVSQNSDHNKCCNEDVMFLVTLAFVLTFFLLEYLFMMRRLSPVHTSCECECEANFDVTKSQLIIRKRWTVLNSCELFSAKTELWRQTHVIFASQSHSQEVWTGLYTCNWPFQKRLRVYKKITINSCKAKCCCIKIVIVKIVLPWNTNRVCYSCFTLGYNIKFIRDMSVLLILAFHTPKSNTDR